MNQNPDQNQQTGERTLIVQVDFGDDDIRSHLEEVRLLAVSAGACLCGEMICRRARPDPAMYIGYGKALEIKSLVAAEQAQLVIFNHDLSPAQQRNLEKVFHCRVIDRTSLILDIFALRARSAEGKLQVELAQLEHLSTRLVRLWTHLERQQGGIGVRGPGETQLETDRRLLGNRVKVLKERLARLKRQRRVQRSARLRRGVFSISLAGYTNAGKSTLFNALTHAEAYVANQLFASLDTTSRKLWLPSVGNLVLSDTVGFIRNLPHALVAAFHATLEATVTADLILHVVDCASPVRELQMNEVNRVLQEIGAADVPQIIVWNKIDLTAAKPGIDRDEYDRIRRVRVSARSGAGIELLRRALAEEAEKTRGIAADDAVEGEDKAFEPGPPFHEL